MYAKLLELPAEQLLAGFGLSAALAYLIGSTPWAYIIVKTVTGEDITTHGTGNVGAMNVRRTTGSWGWFAVAVAADGLKGFLPVVLADVWVGYLLTGRPVWVALDRTASQTTAGALVFAAAQAAVLGAVLGHNYSLWLALLKRDLVRTGKGLATGGGALLAYDWRYFLAALAVGLLVMAVTRYMMAGQVAAALTLPVTALVLRAPDLPFALLLGGLVYAAHHRRFVGLLHGREPRLYIHDRQGPKG